MILHIGVIAETRVHPTQPLRVALPLGHDVGEAIDLDWLSCETGAWAGVVFEKLEVGAEVLVLETLRVGDKSPFRVIGIFPTANAPLPDNSRELARVGDPVKITGTPKFTPAALALAATNTLGAPLAHDLKGRIG